MRRNLPLLEFGRNFISNFRLNSFYKWHLKSTFSTQTLMFGNQRYNFINFFNTLKFILNLFEKNSFYFFVRFLVSRFKILIETPLEITLESLHQYLCGYYILYPLRIFVFECSTKYIKIRSTKI